MYPDPGGPKTRGSGGSGSGSATLSATTGFFVLRCSPPIKMQGLTRTWSEPIVCSRITGRLVTTFLRVPDRLLITLEPGETRVIDRVEAGLEKTWFFFKNPAQCVFWVFLGFLVFWVFLVFFKYICPEGRVFRVFSVSRILLGASRL
jgi:hypothetical protein